MFTLVTWQDYLAADDKFALVEKAIQSYKDSREFSTALDAASYFRGENPTVARKTILRARKMEGRDAAGRRRVRLTTEDVVGNRIPSAFFYRFVTQQNQFLLSEGAILPDLHRDALGPDFGRCLSLMGEKALIHGCCWGYWNGDHLEIIEAARNPYSGFFPLVDEITGEVMLGVQFWQIAPEKPMYIRLFEMDGVTVMRLEGKDLQIVHPKRAYRIQTRKDILGEEICHQENYDALPVIPLYANSECRSELTPAIRAKIDAYDNILSDFGDNLDRANDVYWVLNNFGGTSDDIAEMLEEINRIKAVANLSDGTGNAATAEPHTIEVPYHARQSALQLLEKELYQDYMALDMDALTGSSLTNVAIHCATANLNLKADRYEWQVRQFISRLIDLLGLPAAAVSFRRQWIANESEMVADIAAMRPDIDRRTALQLNPYIRPEDIPALLASAPN
ncbi:MAG: phage portal protein [Clostridiales bacterium]|nr:phage portal protein [Clostridiales bacterium]